MPQKEKKEKEIVLLILKISLALIIVILILTVYNSSILEEKVDNFCASSCKSLGYNTSIFNGSMCLCSDNLHFLVYTDVLESP